MASIRCGHCQAIHSSVTEVRECWDMEQQARIEQEAERAAERYWEERGGPEDDPRERELWASEAERRAAWESGEIWQQGS
jgi:hypothetical protein